MVFKQSYSIEIKVKGRSTMQMEMFENMLLSIVETYRKKNVEITLSDSKGNALNRGNEFFSFVVHSNGVPQPDYKKR